MQISRPAVTGLERQFAAACAALPELVDTVRERPYNVDLVLSEALELAQLGSMVEPLSPLVPYALRIAAQANGAIFRMACAGKCQTRLALGDTELTVSPAIDRGHVEPSKWMQGFFLAALCRDEGLLEVLSETPTKLLRESSTRAPEYMYLFVDSLRAFRVGSPASAGDKMIEAMAATSPDRDDILAEDWVLYIDVRLLNLLFRVNANEGFEKALIDALDQHKQYWTEIRGRERDYHGFLPIGILGLAAIAYDRGIRFDVDSEYLPMHLVRGAF